VTTSPDQSLEEFTEHEAKLEELRSALHRAQRQLAQAKERNAHAIIAAQRAAIDAVLGLPRVKIPTPRAPKANGSPEVALWDTGDWQGHKLTRNYNGEVMRRRVREFCDKAIQMTEIQRAHHPVNKAVIIFGGDMLEGLFNFPSQVYEIDATLFEQVYSVADLEAEVVRRALSTYQEVEVIAEWGNHGRIGNKRASVPGHDNLDRFAYEHARRVLLADPSVAARLRWEDCPEDIQRLEIGNYRALVIHGDEIGRNGWASDNALRNHVQAWKSGAYRGIDPETLRMEPWAFSDVYTHHYHTHTEIPLADGRGAIYRTGSTESDNRYAMVGMASGADPSQRLHFIDPVAGIVTAQYKLWLDPSGPSQ
jgi:hypothetical protein